MAEKCKGFICGGNLVDGSVPSDKLDKETIIELIKEILKEEMHESWLKEIIETILKESIDSDWLREFFKEVLKKYAYTPASRTSLFLPVCHFSTLAAQLPVYAHLLAIHHRRA